MSIVIREAQNSDIEHVIALFCETGGNPYGWNVEKWMHYYRHYPDGDPVSLVAIRDNVIVGHYGLQPIKIGNVQAMLALHAYVAESQRGLAIISALMAELEKVSKLHGAEIICGFSNPKFTTVKTSIFKWRVLCWLGFQRGVSQLDYSLMRSKRFYFNHSEDWLAWRFGSLKDRYVSLYLDEYGGERLQLLKWRKDEPQPDDEKVEVWSPRSMYGADQTNRFCQPFVVKTLKHELVEDGVLDYRNWSIDMGDSDTFQYRSAGMFT